jgi:hypothetical protein
VLDCGRPGLPLILVQLLAAALALALAVGRLVAFVLVVVVAFAVFSEFVVVVMVPAVLVSLGPAQYPPVLASTLEMPCQSKGRNSVRSP